MHVSDGYSILVVSRVTRNRRVRHQTRAVMVLQPADTQWPPFCPTNKPPPELRVANSSVWEPNWMGDAKFARRSHIVHGATPVHMYMYIAGVFLAATIHLDKFVLVSARIFEKFM